MAPRTYAPDANSTSWIFPKIEDLVIEFAREGFVSSAIAEKLGLPRNKVLATAGRARLHGHLSDAEAARVGVDAETALAAKTEAAT